MHAAAADLEFETAARLRDEIKRLRETELAIADDPLARQTDVEDKAGAYRGDRKYGGAPNGSGSDPKQPQGAPIAMTRGGVRGGLTHVGLRPPASSATTSPCSPPSRRPRPCPAPARRKPSLDDMGPGTDRPDACARRRRRLAHPQTHARRDGLALATARSPRALPTSTRAPRPAPTASRSAARTSPPSTRWAPTPSAACPSPARPVPPKPPMKTIEIFDTAEKKARRGRPRKTGRPGA